MQKHAYYRFFQKEIIIKIRRRRGWTEMNTWEANIRKVVPYTPGEQPNQPDMIKLNTNENPYPPAPGVEKALHGIQPDTLRLYPYPTASDLVHAIARNYGLKDEQVFVGVGSDDVLA